jgi:hypothetical protein
MNNEDIRLAMRDAGDRPQSSDIIQPYETLKTIMYIIWESNEAREDSCGISSLTGVSKQALTTHIQDAMQSLAQVQQQQNRNQNLINNLR